MNDYPTKGLLDLINANQKIVEHRISVVKQSILVVLTLNVMLLIFFIKVWAL